MGSGNPGRARRDGDVGSLLRGAEKERKGIDGTTGNRCPAADLKHRSRRIRSRGNCGVPAGRLG